MNHRSIAIALCVALIPGVGMARGAVSVSTTAAVVAAMAASSAAAGNQQNSSSQPEPVTSSRRWSRVGYLICPSGLSKPRGCEIEDKSGWVSRPTGNIEPWIDWMKRHAGSSAQFMGMVRVQGEVTLYYGIEEHRDD